MIHRIHSSMLLASLCALAGALAVAACGGGSDGPPSKLSDAFLEGTHRTCQKAFDCKASYVSSMHLNRTFEDYVAGTTVDACANTRKTMVLAANGQDYLTKLDASVTAGRIKYSSTDYDTCVTAFEAQTCDQVFRQNGATSTPPVACDTSEVGQVATGAACTLDEECATASDSCDSTAQTCGP
jgi:hypothetical protein